MSGEQTRASGKGSPEKRAASPKKRSGTRDPVQSSPSAGGSSKKGPAKERSRFTRPDPVRRIAAGLVDGIPAYLIAFIPFIGGLISAVYLAIRDGLPNGEGKSQSLGKRLLGLKTIRLPEGTPCDYLTSLLRNLPFAVPALIMVRPVKGWILGSFVWGALLLIEILLIVVDENGERLGDRLAGTAVVDASEE